MSASPPQGLRRPGQSFDEWFLEGVLITAEIERDRIRDAKFKQDTSQDPALVSDYLTSAFYAEIHTRKMIDPGARSVVLGYCSMAMQSAIIATYCPEYFEENLAQLAHQVGQYRWAVERQTNLIRSAIWTLCTDRQPGDRIIAAAEAIRGPIPRRRIIELCRTIADATQRKRKRATHARH